MSGRLYAELRRDLRVLFVANDPPSLSRPQTGRYPRSAALCGGSATRSGKELLKHTVSYDEGLLKALNDPEEAQAYLEVALNECEASGEIDGLLLALRDVAQAQGGVGTLAEHSGLNLPPLPYRQDIVLHDA